jgi:hypothetical protein
MSLKNGENKKQLRWLAQGGFSKYEFEKLLAAKGPERSWKEWILRHEPRHDKRGRRGHHAYSAKVHKVNATFTEEEFERVWKKKGYTRNWHDFLLSLCNEKERWG